MSEYEYIYKIVKDMDGVECYIKTGEIVRCKDCKHWYSDADTGMACEFTNMGQPEDGFCNWAERKSDDSD